jgi:hypothetical protein
MFESTVDARAVLEGTGRAYIAKQGEQWNIKTDSLRDELVIDTHFRGLTALYDPEIHEAE